VRQVYFALFGLRVPVRNEAFAAQVLAAVGGRKVRACIRAAWMRASSRQRTQDAPIVVMCQTGGTLETTAERKVCCLCLRAQMHEC
jgi:hypothetical protein